MAYHRRDVPPIGFSQATYSRSGRTTSSAYSAGSWLRFLVPAQLTKEAMVQVHTSIVVGMSFIATDRTSEELPPTLFDPLRAANREPLTFRATMGAVLRCSSGIDLNSNRRFGKRLFTGELIDLSP